MDDRLDDPSQCRGPTPGVDFCRLVRRHASSSCGQSVVKIANLAILKINEPHETRGVRLRSTERIRTAATALRAHLWSPVATSLRWIGLEKRRATETVSLADA